LVARKLCLGELAWRCAIDAGGGQMHDAPNATALAGLPEGSHPSAVDAGRRVIWTILKYAGAVDHRINAGKVGHPIAGIGSVGYVELDPGMRVDQPFRGLAAGDDDDLVTARHQTGSGLRADQSVGSENQDTHEFFSHSLEISSVATQ
jgi:hypothetical protein